MECRSGCAACCIAPHISSPLPGMPHGKPAGEHCINLDANMACVIWNTEHYPAVCSAFKPAFEHCASGRNDALQILTLLEAATSPTD